MSNRIATSQRVTSESRIEVEINLDGTGKSEISTGLPFFNH
ncbi:imidazoleglycerol-phosphate dehydratase, partial [Corynebacterium flavescens]